MKFTIDKVGQLTGLSAVTLRNWEKRYGFPCPQRADSGHRFYSCTDIEFLRHVKELLTGGHNLSQISALYKETKHVAGATKSPSKELVDDVEYRVHLLYKSLIGFNTKEALGHYNILNAKLSPEKFFDRVSEVIMLKLGQDGLENKISAAQQHFASSFLRTRLLSFLTLDLPVARPLRFLGATLARERHEGGMLLVVAHLKFRGYAVDYFGPNVPGVELNELVREIKPDCLLLSYLEPKRFVLDLQKIADLNIPICVSGKAFTDSAFVQKIHKKAPKNLFIVNKSVSSETASYVEMVCQAK